MSTLQAAAPDAIPETVRRMAMSSGLLKAKVAVPDPAEGCISRSKLVKQLEPPAQKRVSVLQAPGGFGKTTLLVEAARRAKARGEVVAWITLDEDDTPELFGIHLAHAFRQAGLDLSIPGDDSAWAASPIAYQIGTVARAIERHAEPCLLMLDELEQLPANSVPVLDRLLQRGPANLRFALAFRDNPGLDLAGLVLAGAAVVLGTEEFRFSKVEIPQLFGRDLTPGQLADIVDRTAGWPVALRVYQNAPGAEQPERNEPDWRLAENFLGVRLLRDLSDEDRAALLDLSVFDWLDPDLVDEVLGSDQARRRIERLASLDGLLTRMDGRGTTRRLHPLVKAYCAERLGAEDAARKRELHRGIAAARVRRGHFVQGWRHAREAGDPLFLGELMARVGVYELWLRDGTTSLLTADRFLTPLVMEMFPRLALLHCVALLLERKVEEASALYDAVGRNTNGFTRDRDGRNLHRLAPDRIFTLASLAGRYSPTVESVLTAALESGDADAENAADADLLLCGRRLHDLVSGYEAGSFEMCREHGAAALKTLARREWRYGEVFANLHLGQAAMAQGRTDEARERYAQVRRSTTQFFAADASLAAITDALVIEIDIEQNREKAIQQRTLSGLANVHGTWIDTYHAALAVAAELTFTRYGPAAVIRLLENSVAHVRLRGNTRVSRTIFALLAYYLSESGSPDRAAQVWRDEELPERPDDLTSLGNGQSWRAMETVSCARISLLTALGEYGAAQNLADRLCAAASDHGLLRTLMRGLALAMVAYQRAGREDQALTRLVEFLRRLPDGDYLRPLVRHRDVSCDLLRRLSETAAEPHTRAAAGALLERLNGPIEATEPSFTPRELAVLAGLRERLSNKEIADKLGLTDGGVRFHIKNLYRKTGITGRRALLGYARSRHAAD